MLPSHIAPRLVSAATARILSAYQTRHPLSADDAANLGRVIAETLAALSRDIPKAPSIADAKPKAERAKRVVRSLPDDDGATPDVKTEIEPEIAPKSEPDSQIEDEAAEILMAVLSLPELPSPEAVTTDSLPAKRKRPSRPRPKRGNREAVFLPE